MLVGKNIVLRTVREKDLDRLYDLAADVRDLGDYWPLGIASEHAWTKRFRDTGWCEPDHTLLLITDHTDDILGQVNFFKAAIHQNSLELGYRLYSRKHWGKGITTEAVRLVVPFLFATRTVDRIQATIIPGNTGSRRVLEKCGFRLEGVMRKAIFHHGVSADVELYSVLREECPTWREVASSALEAPPV